MNILLVGHEKDLLKLITENLRAEGLQCEVAYNLSESLGKISKYNYDCLVVDLLLPDGSGLAVIRRLKERKSNSGIIVTSARGQLTDRIICLEVGADDYLPRPFDLMELNVRIKAIIRRRKFEAQNEMTIGDIVISPNERTVKVNGKDLILTKREFELLLYFMSNPNRALTKEDIIEQMWGSRVAADSFDFIYSQIKNLRRKISNLGGRSMIKTIYGIGYRFQEN